MNAYRPTHDALDDLETLLYSFAVRSGWEASMRMEEKLFVAFDKVAKTPNIGHLRTDLIPRDLYCYYSEPYLVIYRRETNPVAILAVIHGARDVAAVMRERVT